MAGVHETAIYSSLHELESVETMLREGLPLECLTEETMRPVVQWVFDAYYASGMKQAPSRAAILEVYGEVIEDAGVELADEDEQTESVAVAIERLKSDWIEAQFQEQFREAALQVRDADAAKKIPIATEHTLKLLMLTVRLAPATSQADAHEGVRDAVQRYQERQNSQGVAGMKLGWDQVDTHTGGIQPGELAILAAGPKAGKSQFLARSALLEFMEAGRHVALFTLENSVEMTWDRMVCMHLGIDPRKWQRGECSEHEVERVRGYEDAVRDAPGSIHIISPGRGERTPAALVRRAEILGAESLYIDQLTFLEHEDPRNKPRHVIVGEIMHDLKTLISAQSKRIPCLLAHQINREGVKAAEKSDHLRMDHLAESAETERTADWVFGLYVSPAERTMLRAKLQILAARREELAAWQVTWRRDTTWSEVLRPIPVEW